MKTSETKVQLLKPERDESTIEILKEWLADAERGEIVGVVLLGNKPGDKVQHGWAGTMPAGVALLAFEWWKRSAFGDG